MFSRKDIQVFFQYTFVHNKLICVLHALAQGSKEYHKNMYLSNLETIVHLTWKHQILTMMTHRYFT